MQKSNWKLTIARILAAAGTISLTCLLFANAPATLVDPAANPRRSDFIFHRTSMGRADIGRLLPPAFALPDDTVALYLSIDPETNDWFRSKLDHTLTLLANGLPEWPSDAQINAILIDAESQIRVIYSNSPETYFGSDRRPLASTAKIFVAVALGQHDRADDRYCIPRTITRWITMDTVFRCSSNASTVSASMAFARSMPAPLLWRSRQILDELTLKRVFLQLGIVPGQYPSLIDAAILGYIQARPIELHRAVHAITLALAGRVSDAKMPRLIRAIETDHSPPDIEAHEAAIDSSPVSHSRYSSVITPAVVGYLRDVLSAPIRFGTLRALSSPEFSRSDIDFVWGKTGTYAVRGDTHTIWIVGGLSVAGKPYSWLLLVNSADATHSFGNTNAAAFAPIARLLAEAAIRHSDTEVKASLRLIVD
jgi:hypothetical protein